MQCLYTSDNVLFCCDLFVVLVVQERLRAQLASSLSVNHSVSRQSSSGSQVRSLCTCTLCTIVHAHVYTILYIGSLVHVRYGSSVGNEATVHVYMYVYLTCTMYRDRAMGLQLNS